VTRYEVAVDGSLSDLRATCDNKDVKVEIEVQGNQAWVTGTYNGLKKIYTIKQK
jgi:hypothetical protein